MEIGMWERKVKTAKWNGVAFNIQQTTLDNGKRLQVVELPYADDPYIKVMGAKAKGINLEAVFVGVNSLADANAFVAKLESDPIGALEHPYLGEMSLVYQSVSQSFSTKKGLVTLALKFLKQGKAVALTRVRIDEKPLSELSNDLMAASKQQFMRDMAAASPDEISTLQDDFNNLLSTLKSIASRSSQDSMRLTHLHHEIQDGMSAVSTIVNAPGNYADHLSAMFDNLTRVLLDDKDSNASSNIALNPLHTASTSLRKRISVSPVSAHCNIQITVAIVLISEELALLSTTEQPTMALFVGHSIDNIARNINAIRTLIEERIEEVTQSADYESLALVESINALHESVINQGQKIAQLLQTIKRIEVIKPRPLLCIAQSNAQSRAEISALNSIPHPLFVSGLLRVPNA
jgi:prophage DNA circulation protein